MTSLSTRFASLELEQLTPALVYALEQTCLALNVDRSTIIEFDENGTIHTSHSCQRRGVEEPRVEVEPASWRWLTGRLMNREVVTVSRLEDLPMEALAEREYARRSGMSSMLAVPVTIGERTVWCAGGRQRPAVARVACAHTGSSAAPRRHHLWRAAAEQPGLGASREHGRNPATQPPIDRRQRLPQGRHQDVPRFRRDRRRERGDARRPGTARPGRAAQLRGPAARRNRHRQGTVCPCRARPQPSPVACARTGELRRAAAQPD